MYARWIHQWRMLQKSGNSIIARRGTLLLPLHNESAHSHVSIASVSVTGLGVNATELQHISSTPPKWPILCRMGR